jgi:hypothetical protein
VAKIFIIISLSQHEKPKPIFYNLNSALLLLIRGKKTKLAEWRIVDVTELRSNALECTLGDCFKFTALRAWTLPFNKLVFINSNMKVLSNLDHLFNLQLDESIIYATKDCSNVSSAYCLVLQPSINLFDELAEQASRSSDSIALSEFVTSFFSAVPTRQIAYLDRTYNCDWPCLENPAFSAIDCKVAYGELIPEEIGSRHILLPQSQTVE